MVELYGRGRYFDFYNYYDNGQSYIIACGGSSCQVYDSIYLIKNSTMSISIGQGSSGSDVVATRTTFGSYSVDGGGSGMAKSQVYYAGGKGAGNKGQTGSVKDTVDRYNIPITYSTGTFYSLYGYSAGYKDTSSSSSFVQGGNGAVYIKYLRT